MIGLSSISFADQTKVKETDEYTESYLGSIPEKIKSLSLAIKKDPKNPELYAERGIARTHLGTRNYYEGISATNKKILEEGVNDFLNQYKFAKNKDDFNVGLWHAAESHLLLGNYQEAIRLMTITVDCYPDDPDTYWHRLLINADAGMCHKLDADYDILLKLRPELIMERANDMFMCGRYVEAIRDFTTLIDKHKNSFNYFNRARCYDQVGDYKNANRDIKKAIALDKDGSQTEFFSEFLNEFNKHSKKHK